VSAGAPSAAVVDGEVQIRAATPDDVELIFSYIVELAEYERARDQVTGTLQLLEQSLFGEPPSAEAVIARLGGEPAGIAVFHSTFSTWECRAGIWLEDLYVPPQHRRAGVGRALLSHLAAIAVQRGCPRLEWHVLDWNAPALDFYDRLGAKRLHAWELHRLDGDALALVAGERRAARS
jgi:GNAT superfamily N-acetyltransferase